MEKKTEWVEGKTEMGKKTNRRGSTFEVKLENDSIFFLKPLPDFSKMPDELKLHGKKFKVRKEEKEEED